MASLNKVLLMGNLTRDPQISYLPSKLAVVDLGLAINRRYKGGDGEMKKEENFVDCKAYGKLAETITKNFKKGKPIFIEGRLKYDTWQGQDNKKCSKIRVIIENFGFIDGLKPQEEKMSEFSMAEARPEMYLDSDACPSESFDGEFDV